MLRLWKKSPGLRLLLPFLIGIAADHILHPSHPIWFLVLVPSLLIYLSVHTTIRRMRYVYRFLPGISIVPLLFALGGLLSHVHDPLRSQSHYVHRYRPDDIWLARITSVPVLREKTVRAEAVVIGLDRHGNQLPAEGKIMVTFENDSTSQLLAPDDVIAVSARIKMLNQQANPCEFNYAAFLQNRSIYRQSYAKASEWRLVKKETTHSVSGYFLLWREYFIGQLRSHIEGKEEFSVLAALILGKTEFIEQDMMQAYASAGAIHILAVSGLHVGLIYVVLAPLLRRLFPGKSKRWLKFLIPAAILWLYAGVTGFSPSVLRAALMFTAFIIADTWERNSSSYNTIGISAFILLCWNPRMISEPGFLLSYLAVLGIIMLQKKMSDSFAISNHWLQKMWQLSAVTLAAQITTFPLSIYYFHQFPLYFLFSNLIVIPISTVLLYAGLVFLLVCWIPHLSDLVANINATITSLMNGIIQWFDQLPMSTLRGFSPGIPEMILLYFLMWTLSSWLFWKKQRALLISMVIAVLLGALHILHLKEDSKQNLCCIHALRNHTCLTFLVGNHAYVVTDSAMIADEQLRKFHLENFLHEMNITSTHYIDFEHQSYFEDHQFRMDNGVIQTSALTVGFWDQINRQSELPGNPDYVYLDAIDPKNPLDSAAFAFLSTKKVILGSGISEGKMALLIKKTQNSAGIFSLKDGAVILEKCGIQHHIDWFENRRLW